METKSLYGVTVELRPECLLANSDWVEPNADEVRAVLKMSGWSGEEFARRVGVDGRTVRRWTLGEKSVTYSPWCVLCVQAGLGNIWMNRPLAG